MTSGSGDPRAIHRALLARARQEGADFNALCVQFAIERLLYRLARSDQAERFVLKGAMLFRAWTGDLHRPTKDVDLLGHGDPTPASMASAIRSIAATPVDPDGIGFDLSSIVAREIREAQSYGGIHVDLDAYLGEMRLVVRVDVGFGDAVIPAPKLVLMPAMLDHEPPRLRIYPPETVVAEKLEAICTLGLANSRMKDFYDLLIIGRRFDLDADTLGAAIHATFERRGTDLPLGRPTGLSPSFAADRLKISQWRGFLARLSISVAPGELAGVIEEVWAFVAAPIAKALGGSGPES
ncbi:nucleotidyl transferase AbiEii/AbiGii toxin family protein [Engelhardtia mirabilis]|uniref:Nucleotidyl transferase AbiEii toxin, Type IV TA system n=1 Tax=Engelhardtia mirabilis TaxID=2528011 RepID=A0A518BH10_9BACT|nr:hypothetical protein Pla133_13210 [Planctomycetes bacterium Pla133]QDV00582.1 hypothetical protein Pla86_13210 [Planctomycetes bacterium Pla86]